MTTRPRVNILSHTLLVSLLLTGLLAGCNEIDPNAPGAVSTGSVNFARYLAFGNSLTAGYQSGGLVEKNQRVSYPAQIATAARAPRFEMPLISEPGIPPLLFVSSLVPSPVLDTLPGFGQPPTTLLPGPYNNLGIPGATVHDMVTRRPDPDPFNPFFQIVLRDTAFGPTALAQAMAIQPTIATVWIGANDVLGSAASGTDQLLTGTASFEADFRTIVDGIRGASDALIVANLPDVASAPFFTTVPPVLVNPLTRQPVIDPSTGFPVPLIGEFQGGSGNLPITSLLTLPAASFLAQGVGIPIPFGGTGAPLPDAVILDPTELLNLQTRNGEFNAIIDSICANRNIPVIDMFTFFNDLGANGVVLRGGDVFTTDYLSGGLFSVDGIHPSALGYFVLAREFIRKINLAFGASIPDPPLPAGPIASLIPPTTQRAFPVPKDPAVFAGLWRSLGVPTPSSLRR